MNKLLLSGFLLLEAITWGYAFGVAGTRGAEETDSMDAVPSEL